MVRCGEKNHHVHDGYEENMALSSDVNDTDEDESNNSIVQERFTTLHQSIYVWTSANQNATQTYRLMLLRN